MPMTEFTCVQRFMVKAGCIVGSGGVLFGYDIGVIAGSLGQLTDTYDLNTWEQGVVVSLISAGAVLGCIIGGPLCDHLGRWWTIHLQNAIFIAGALIVATSQSLSALYVGRIVIGFASALSGIADVAYLIEVSPPSFRGRLSSSYELLTCMGVLVSFIVSWQLQGDSNGWRIMFLVPGILAFLQSVGVMWLPESPKWLAINVSQEACDHVLVEIYGNRENAAHMRDEIILEIAENRRICGNIVSDEVLLSSSTSPLAAGAATDAHCDGADGIDKGNEVDTVTAVNQSSNERGSNSAAAVRERERERECNHSSNYAAAANSCCYEMTSSACNHHTAAINTVDRTGAPRVDSDSDSDVRSASISGNNCNNLRQKWMTAMNQFNEYWPSLIVIIMLQILSNITGGIVIRNYAPVIFEEPGTGISESTAVYLNVFLGAIKLIFVAISVSYVDNMGRKPLLLGCCAVIGTGMLILTLGFLVCERDAPALLVPVFMVGCSLIIAGYSIGFGPVNWILSTEMFPTDIRGSAVSVSVFVSNLGQFITNLMFLPLVSAISPAATFFLFFLICITAYWYIWTHVVETMELSPETILEHLLAIKKSWRERSASSVSSSSGGGSKSGSSGSKSGSGGSSKSVLASSYGVAPHSETAENEMDV